MSCWLSIYNPRQTEVCRTFHARFLTARIFWHILRPTQDTLLGHVAILLKASYAQRISILYSTEENLFTAATHYKSFWIHVPRGTEQVLRPREPTFCRRRSRPNLILFSSVSFSRSTAFILIFQTSSHTVKEETLCRTGR